MVNPSDFRNGMTIEWEGELWVVLEFQQGQNARGDTFFRTKLRNVRSGAIIDQKFRDRSLRACPHREGGHAVPLQRR
jgi:elongation factor P